MAYVRGARQRPPDEVDTAGLEVRRLPQVPGGPWVPRERVLALTFDDGPSPAHTPRVLDVLAEQDVPATFFMVGRRSDTNPELARRVAQAGHLIASHGYTHRDLVFQDQQRIRYQIESSRASLRHHTGQPVRFFRPPFTSRDERVHAAVAAAGQVFAHWSISVNDRKHDAGTIAGSVGERLRPGAIILLHEHDQAIDALPLIISTARAARYRFVTLDGTPSTPFSPEPATDAPRRIGSLPSENTAGLVVSLYPRAGQVIVSGMSVGPDVAAAVALAGATGAPILPAANDQLASPLQAQVERLKPAEAVIVGDEDAVGAGALGNIGAHARSVHRVAGTSSYGTAAQVAREMADSLEVFVTLTSSWCSLLATAATAGRRKAPVLAVPAGRVPAEIVDILRELRPERIVLVGDAADDLSGTLTATGARTVHVRADGPAAISAELARVFPPTGGVWLTPAGPPAYATIVAAAAAAREDAALLFVEPGRTEPLAQVVRALGHPAVMVVGHESDLPEHVVTGIVGTQSPSKVASRDSR